MAYTVNIENTFRGPLDLLLYLVKRDEIDLHNIPIAHLTREYLAELGRMHSLDIDLGGDFVAMASMLMEIKSRMMLPATDQDAPDEDEEDFDPRSGLVQALLEYKRFKEAAADLGRLHDEHSRRFMRLPPIMEHGEDDATIDETSVMDLYAAFNRMARNLITSDSANEIVSDEVPTEVRITQIRRALAVAGKVRFSLLISSEPTRAEMVGFFIALLELIRLREVRARQAVDFADIYIEPRPRDDTAGNEKTLPAPLPATRRQQVRKYRRCTLFGPFSRIPAQPLQLKRFPAFLAGPRHCFSSPQRKRGQCFP